MSIFEVPSLCTVFSRNCRVWSDVAVVRSGAVSVRVGSVFGPVVACTPFVPGLRSNAGSWGNPPLLAVTGRICVHW